MATGVNTCITSLSRMIFGKTSLGRMTFSIPTDYFRIQLRIEIMFS
jgi:hypothetical protein